MTFERESLETAFRSWRRYLTWGIHKANGLCNIGEDILLKKWFHFWKDNSLNNCKQRHLERRIILLQRLFEQWKSFCTTKEDRFFNKKVYFNEWRNRARAKSHAANVMARIVMKRKIIQSMYCIRRWKEAYEEHISNIQQSEHSIRKHFQRSRHLVSLKYIRDTPFILVIRFWRKWRELTASQTSSIDTPSFQRIMKCSSSSQPDMPIDANTNDKFEISFSKKLQNLSPTEHNEDYKSNEELGSSKDSEFNFSVILQRKKEQFSRNIESLKDARKLLKKAECEVSIYQRAIDTCSQEIDRHCCICGGIHVFNDHEPTKYINCKRLKSKTRSFMHLKQARAQAIGRVRDWKASVQQCKKEIEESRRSLSLVLHDRLFQQKNYSCES